MDNTRKSLLLRIRDKADGEAWREFHAIYAPFIYGYARKRGLRHEDAEDVRAACFDAIVRHVARFDYDPSKGGFRNWLRTLVAHSTIDLLRKRRPEQAESDVWRTLADSSAPDDVWEREWRHAVLRQCIARVRLLVADREYQAFRLLVVAEKPVRDVCDILGITANQAYKAKSNVLRCVREESKRLEQIVN